jgi:hypothetical protein
MIGEKNIKKLEEEMIFQLEILYFYKEVYKEVLKKGYKIKELDFEELVRLLEKRNFIVTVLDKKGELIRIKEEGISFLMDERKNKQQLDFNATLTLATIIVAILTIFTFLKEMFGPIPFFILGIACVLIGFCFIPLVRYLFRISLQLTRGY